MTKAREQYSDKHVCGDGEICVGVGCDFRGGSTAVLEDGTRWVGDGATHFFSPNDCPFCTCQPAQWPWHRCSRTLVGARAQLMRALNGRYEILGFGSRFNGMLHVAALALERGAGFQWGSQVCAADRRSGPFCLFRPVSACGKAPIAACTNPMRLGVGGADCFDWGLSPDVLPAVNTSPPWADEAPPVPTVEYRPNRTRLCGLLLRRSSSRGSLHACLESELEMWRLLTRLVARPQPEVQSEALATWLPRTGIPVQTWESGHFAALHVRRTDKKIETRRSSSCLYLGKLAHLAYKTGLMGADALYIFVATDDPAVLRELRRCPPPPEVKKPQAYRFVSLVEGWRAPSRGFGQEQLLRLWAEVEVLCQARAVVGTFSSNLGRLVQLLRRQPLDTFASLNTPGRTGWFHSQGAPEPSIDHPAGDLYPFKYGCAISACPTCNVSTLRRASGFSTEPLAALDRLLPLPEMPPAPMRRMEGWDPVRREWLIGDALASSTVLPTAYVPVRGRYCANRRCRGGYKGECARHLPGGNGHNATNCQLCTTGESIRVKSPVDCAAAVARNGRCGRDFSFGGAEGWCDCVPKGKTCALNHGGTKRGGNYTAFLYLTAVHI